MLKTKRFEIFGIIYENKQMPALEAFDMIDYLSILTPVEVLKYCQVVKYDGSFRPLTEQSIDVEVKDCIGFAPANKVLKALMESVLDHNFGFLKEWKGVKIPSRFISNAKTEKSTYVEPIIAQLTTANMATYKELEEYYSLQDAFAMFDALLVKTVNEGYAHEEAAAAAKSNR